MTNDSNDWGLKTLIESIQRNQADNHQSYINAFTSLSAKMDKMTSNQATISERLDNHIDSDNIALNKHEEKINQQEQTLKFLEKQNWIRHGQAAGIAGIITGLGWLFHK